MSRVQFCIAPCITSCVKPCEKLKYVQRGFTLIELLIALAVSAVIAALAYQSVNGMVKVQSAMQEHTDRSGQVQRAIWWMEQDFIQMVPRPILDGLGSSLPALQYRADLGLELSRLAQFPTPNASGGLLRVGYELEDETLVRFVWPVLDRAPDTQPTRQVVLTGVKRFTVRFLKALPSANDLMEPGIESWVEVWPQTWTGEALTPVIISATSTAANSSSKDALTALPVLTEVQIELDDLGIITRLFRGVDAVDWSTTVRGTQVVNDIENDASGDTTGDKTSDATGEVETDAGLTINADVPGITDSLSPEATP
ncbi:type II secretion system minor pseudopilin GspJ [Thiomicrorhabdus aquaedulcis]|uniref:type II secretion system minor pseudopilin GspJ n=1 Tax=Thiomicrorhabdus aquaedulcis TaxID=2211106 RepID=UPI000FD94D14|nr:type II secretion system minor pseudopilin GspJ [Thiomicrorhabdus aquaedulcis]